MESWRADRWQTPVRQKIAIPAIKLGAIKLARFCRMLGSNQPATPRYLWPFRAHRRRTAQRLLRKLWTPQAVCLGGIQ